MNYFIICIVFAIAIGKSSSYPAAFHSESNPSFVDTASLELSSSRDERTEKILSQAKSSGSIIFSQENTTEVPSKVPFDNPDFIPGEVLNDDLKYSEKSLEEELNSDFEKIIIEGIEGELLRCVLLTIGLFFLGIIFIGLIGFIVVSSKTQFENASFPLKRLKRKRPPRKKVNQFQPSAKVKRTQDRKLRR